MKSFTLCADDYAQSPIISAAIRCLAEEQRISSVSCLTESPHWPQEAERLAPLRETISIGLHLNLTHPFHRNTKSLGHWIRKAALRRIDVPEILAQFHSQYEAFVKHLGHPPDYIDGHQHIHVFPGIRDALFALLDTLPHHSRPAVRSFAPLLPTQAPDKRTTLLKLLTRGFDPAAHGLITNDSFAGFYRFRDKTSFPEKLKQWLQSLTDNTIIMCHPGLVGPDPGDPICQGRHREFGFLHSDHFPALLESLKLTLKPFSLRADMQPRSGVLQGADWIQPAKPSQLTAP